MRFEPTRALLVLLVPFGTLNCSDPERADSTLLEDLQRVWAPTEQQLTPTPANCRSVATSRNVRMGAARGESSCQFDAARSQLVCRTALGADGEIATVDFASLSDFVEAAHTLGKVTSLREVRRDGDSRWVTSHDYDELGRMIRSREEQAGGDRIYTYRDFDDQGRPRQALPTRDTVYTWGCEAVPFTIEYADGAGTVSYRYQASAACDQLGYSIIEHYDALANRVRVERASADGSETTFEASVPAATQTICD